MRSATTADISDSIAPSMATVSAGLKSTEMSSGRNAGTTNRGQPPGMPPNFVPMVSTGRPATATTAVPPSSATM